MLHVCHKGALKSKKKLVTCLGNKCLNTVRKTQTIAHLALKVCRYIHHISTFFPVLVSFFLNIGHFQEQSREAAEKQPVPILITINISRKVLPSWLKKVHSVVTKNLKENGRNTNLIHQVLRFIHDS